MSRINVMLLMMVVMLGITAQAYVIDEGRCDPSNRTDCGYYGIKQPECEGKGCCWVTGPSTVPWCFFTSAPSPACSTTPQCSGHGSCADGACSCDTGFSTCGDVSVKDCGVDVYNDVENCGGCGTSCYNGDGVASRSCGKGSCNVQCQDGYSLCFGECYDVDDCSTLAPFTDSDMEKIGEYFLANIDMNGAGSVVASPSQSSPDYYYHWARDGAISVYEMMTLKSVDEVRTQLEHYTNWVTQIIDTSGVCNGGTDPLGEPKWMLDGSCFTDGWMRPQNDGSGLRAIALITFANKLIDAGEQDYVTENLYHTDASQPGIKKDLEYVVSIWDQETGDPWEEVRGQVFFQKMASRKALKLGADLADKLGDSGSASNYRNVASSIESDIDSTHWSASENLIMEVPQTRELDSATHLAVLYGSMGDGFYDPSSDRVQSSVSILVNSFSNGYFSINDKDDQAGIPGLLIGRYLQDSYNGGNPSQPGSGNPWILCSASLAEIYYRNAESYATSGMVNVTNLNEMFFQDVIGLSAYGRSTNMLEMESLRAGRVVSLSEEPLLFSEIVQGLALSGDGILMRIKHHVQDQDMHMTEQINKDNGDPQGAHDLTWSYGTVIGAMNARANAFAAMDRVAKMY